MKRRVGAWAVDFALVVTVAVLLGVATSQYVAATVTADAPALAGESAWRILFSESDPGGAAEELGGSVWRRVVRAVQQAFGALVLLTFVYHFAMLALTGRTVGKAVVGLRVRPGGTPTHGGLSRRQAGVRAAVTTVADVGCFALACCLLVGGDVALSVLCWAVAVAVFWLNGLPALRGSGRSLADRVAGTRVRVRNRRSRPPLPSAVR